MVAASLALPLRSPPAPAVAAGDAPAPPPPPGIRLTARTVDVVEGAFRTDVGMALWVKGRRGYQLTSSDTYNPDGIAAVDLVTGEEVVRTTLSRPAESRPIEEILAVDEEGGRLYLARQGFQFTECTTNQCVSGFHVLDAATLQPTGPEQITLSTVADDGTATSPKLLALRFEPARFEGDRPKLLAMYIEGANDDFSGAKYPTGLTYLAQFDAETGTRDFAIRLGVCNGDRSTSIDSMAIRGGVFRVRQPGPPVIYVGCMSSSRSGQVVRVTVDPTAPTASVQENFPGPLEVNGVVVDPAAQRIAMRSGFSRMQWWIFDGKRSTFTGVVGIGSDAADTSPGFDATTGRLYSLAPDPNGGLFVSDIRRTPVPGATPYRQFAALAGSAHSVIAVDPAGPGRPRQLYVRATPYASSDHFKVLEDTVPISTDIPMTADPGRTRDIDEDATTRATYTGTARGFGIRSILVGGVEAVPRSSFNDIAIVFRNPIATPFGTCGPRDREIILADAGEASLTEEDSTGRARAVVTDQTTRGDLGRPVTRCTTTIAAGTEVTSPEAVNGIEDAVLDGASSEPDSSPVDRFAGVECVAPDPDPSRGAARTEDPLASGVFAEASCSDEARSASQLEIADVAGIKVAQVSSSVSVVRDPKRGLVSRVTSTARGVQLPGGVTIDAVTTTAESWANGRRQPTAFEDGGEVTDPNCDRARTAGTCLQRTLQGVQAGTFHCTQCDANEPAFIDGMNRALGREWQFRVRQADPRLAQGSSDGYTAGLQKPFDEEFSDLSLNSDPLLTIPAFEMVRTVDGSTGRGRQIFQFAAVQLGTTYAIELLPVELDDGPAAMTVKLVSDEGEPLAGGTFRVHADRDADGVVGLLDDVVEGGTCVTSDDGTGDCDFPDLEPGPYVVEQTAAPSGYAASPDLELFLTAGERATATFTNLRAVGSVEIALTDDADPPAPLPGGRFELHADDGDGALGGGGDRLYDTCTTGDDGTCGFPEVPVGAYVLRQVEAPVDHLAADDAAFALTAPGQVASISVVNGLAGVEGTEGMAGFEGEMDGVGEEVVDEIVDPGADGVEIVIEDGDLLPIAQVTVAPLEPEDGGGLVKRLLAVPEALSRYLARHPFEALLFGAVWGLFAVAAVLVARRRMFVASVATTGPTAPFAPPPRT